MKNVLFALSLSLLLPIASCDDDGGTVPIEICNNAADDDGDGLFDCDDPDCAGYGPCQTNNTNNTNNTSNSDVCGNDRAEAGEECDGDDLLGATCQDFGYHSGILTCGGNCRYDVSGCGIFVRCGDGTMDAYFGEQCDGSDLDGATCQDLGYYSGTLSCGNDCLFNTANCETFGKCGDGARDEDFGEECDQDDLGGVSCESIGGYFGTLQCDDACRLDYSFCMRCGDGFVQEEQGEECDQGSFHGATCETLGFYGGTISCASDCLFDSSGCTGFCGDGAIDAAQGEECDGEDLNGVSCQDLGFIRGEVFCTPSCQISALDCSNTVIFEIDGSYLSGVSGAGLISPAGDLMAIGNSFGTLWGTALQSSDGFAGKFSASGELLWNQFFQTSGYEFIYGGAVHSDGSVAVVGYTNAGLYDTNAGNYDVFVAKLAADGSFLWGQQFGTSSTDYARAVTVDNAGNIYFTGESASGFLGMVPNTGNPYLVKLDPDGNVLWSTFHPSSASNSYARAIAVNDAGEVYVAGTIGDSSAQDIRIWKVAADGTTIWSSLYGAPFAQDTVSDMVLDASGNIYLAGNTGGSLDGQVYRGAGDAILMKIAPDGTVLASTEFGTDGGETGLKLAMHNDRIFMVGTSTGQFIPSPGIDYGNIFVAEFNSACTLQWVDQLKGARDGTPNGLLLHPDGRIFITGINTNGYFDGIQSSTNSDIFFIYQYGWM